MSKLLSYQRGAVRYACGHYAAHSGLLVKMDVGLGKTKVGVAVAKKLNVPALFIVPVSVAHQWKEELPEALLMLTGKDLTPGSNYKYIIATYHAMFSEDLSGMAKGRMVVIDELANFKNADTQRTNRLKELRGKYMLGLTATVVENAIDELFVVLSIVAPEFMTKKHFVNNHVVYNRYGAVDGYYGLKEFREVANKYIYEVTRKDISGGGDDKVDLVHEVVLIPSKVQGLDRLKKLYKNLQELARTSDKMDEAGDYSELLHYQFRNAISKKNVRKMIGSLRKFMSDPSRGGRGKFDYLKKLVWSWMTGHGFVGFPAIVFCNYIDTCKKLHSFFSRVFGKDRVALYIGATPRKKRMRIQEEFNAGKIWILIASSAGTRGIDLPNGKAVVNYDLPWHEAIMTQRNRITRIISHGKKRIFILVAQNGIDEYVYQVIRDKSVQATVLDASGADVIKSRSQSWTAYLRRLLT